MPQAKVIDRRQVADATVALTVERPPGFTFEAGQNLDLCIESVSDIDEFGGRRTLSIASAPYEEHLELAVRLSESPYKKAFERLTAGDYVGVEGPYGTFGLKQEPAVPSVFVAGGIGITPCLSLLRQMAYDGWLGEVYLFYSNRRARDAAFMAELDRLWPVFRMLKLVPTITREAPEDTAWTHERGRVGVDMMSARVPRLSDAHFYVVGTSRMVWSVVRELDQVVQRDQVSVEDFTDF